jgi:hypothetical protein
MNELAVCPASRASAVSHFPAHPIAGFAGTSFKHEHLPAILADGKQDGFFEIHAENYMGAGGSPHDALTRIREDYPLSLHGVCMSIGGPRPLDKAHLRRFKALVDRYEPALVSEHLAWSTHGTTYFNDLLPLPYTRATLARVADHIDEAQETIGRPILLENPSTYVVFRESTMIEADFIRELVRRTGCGLLLDVNNVFVSATNHGYSALGYLADFPLEHVGEIHLAGHAEQADDEDELLLIDSHDGPVAGAVWKLFDIVIGRYGPIPTLVEWDNNIPDWPILKAEAAAARTILDRHAHMYKPGKAHAAHHEHHEQDYGEQPSYAAAFSPALLDPDRATPVTVAGPNGKAARKRYNVYRNNVTVSLIDALTAVFPTTQRITGVDFFRAMARFHVRATPPTSPLLFEYGRDFPDFIDCYEYAKPMPWLAEVARIERAWLDAYHATNAESLIPQALASIPPERLADTVLIPHPATRIVRSRFPAVTIFTANKRTDPVGHLEATDPEDALVTRPGLEVIVRHLPPGGAVFLTQLIAGEPLGAAAAAALADSAAFNLAANIAGMLEAGAFTAIRQGD